jgi:hypothetical protein
MFLQHIVVQFTPEHCPLSSLPHAWNSFNMSHFSIFNIIYSLFVSSHFVFKIIFVFYEFFSLCFVSLVSTFHPWTLTFLLCLLFHKANVCTNFGVGIHDRTFCCNFIALVSLLFLFYVFLSVFLFFQNFCTELCWPFLSHIHIWR